MSDDQPIDLWGLVGLLQTQDDFAVVGEAASGAECIARVKVLHPDVLVLTVRTTPDLDGPGPLSAIRAVSPRTHVLALAERGEGACVVLNPPPSSRSRSRDGRAPCLTATDCLQLAVAQGALGAIRRSADPEDLFRAIRAVSGGNAWYELGTASRLLERALGLDAHDDPRRLSARELEVAALISEGRSNKEIAMALGISEPTVKKHVGHILAKLHLEDRLQLGLYVARNPLIFSRRGLARV